MAELDDTDRALLNRIQSNFPVTPRPYLTIAQELGLTEKDVLKRIARLRQESIIRRIGGNFVPEKLGFVSTLCAANVPEDQIERFAEIVNRYPGVTHNYWRVYLYCVVHGGNRRQPEKNRRRIRHHRHHQPPVDTGFQNPGAV
jgi:DNA-binding Lrp family transcriptional regulator